jgi:SHS2 domain-containing protein
MVGIGYQEIEHTADWAIRVVARSLPQLFELAAQGMFAIAGVQVSDHAGTRERIQLEAFDPESLLVMWLEELLYLIESQELGISNLTIRQIEDNRLTAEIMTGELRSISRDIKAVTYHNLEITHQGNHWSVEIVFDV